MNSCCYNKFKMNFRLLSVSLLLFCIQYLPGADNFAENSILKSGTWYKIRVESTGVYKLTYDDIKELGFETPENIRVYGQSGEQLSYTNSSDFEDDLYEIPLYSSDDDNFSSGDYYLFYAQGPEVIKYDSTNDLFIQSIHKYAVYNYYFITTSFGSGKRIEEEDSPDGTPSNTLPTYNYVSYYEEENLNLIQSGSRWFSMLLESDYEETFTIDNIDVSQPVNLRMAMATRSGSTNYATVTANDNTLFTLSFGKVYLNDDESTYAKINGNNASFTTTSSTIDVGISFTATASTDYVYLDYITLNARAKLVLNSTVLFFRDATNVGTNKTTKFQLSSANSNHQIWDVTTPTDVSSLPTTLSSSSLSFVAETSELREFAAVNIAGDFPSPDFETELTDVVGSIDNQNLHALSTPEYLIVTHPDFIDQAEALAELHEEQDEMSVAVVTTNQVYNEFSGGKPDISAIRNFTRMLWLRSTSSDSLKYLLLFGDASYDNRTLNEDNPNLIPCFEASNSTNPVSSYVTDDFYGFLNTGEGGVSGTLCIGVGRLPIDLNGGDGVELAQEIVDKIELYTSTDVKSDWLNSMVFLGDDGENGWDSTVFMTDSDSLTKIVESYAPAMNIKKIYLDAYEQISTSTGDSYPDAEDDLEESFNKGAFIFNYMGHGGDNSITQESVLTKSDFEQLDNSPYFPIFITATCELSPFDHVTISSGNYTRKVSAGEAVLLNPDGGAIALLTTTRAVTQTSNMSLAMKIYNTMFDRDENGDPMRIGDLFRIAKNTTFSSNTSRANTLKFALLGDPALTLPYGNKKIIIDSVNGISVSSETDTIKALSEVSVSGYLTYLDSSLISDFDGVLYASVFDKEYTVTTYGNDGRVPFNYDAQDNLLFHGKATVEDGRFSFKFKVPKDITYSYGNGKMSFYAFDGDLSAKGAFSGFIIGGTSDSIVSDNEGPEIKLYMNADDFIDGGITDENPVLYAVLSDENGINTTGVGIGHDIVAVLDDSASYVLNAFYVGDLDDYTSGALSYPFNDLDPGKHSITLKAWDTYNNSSEATIEFYVEESGNVVITELISYPNPASSYVNFQYRHNQQDTDHEIVINIYDISGRMLHSIHQTQYLESFVSDEIYWNFEADGSYVGPGVYPYTINVTTSEGIKGKQNGSLIIIP